MPSREHHERSWHAIPEGALPDDFQARLRFLLDDVRAGARVLDVGCGEALFSTELVRAGVSAVGVDVAEEPLRRARARDPALELLPIDGEGAWPLADSSFDVVWAGEVIEHVADTAGWLSEVRRVLRSGGRLLLSTPAHERRELLRLALSRSAFRAELDPRGDHLRFYSRETLTELLADFGFEQIELRLSGRSGRPRTMLARAVRSRY